MVRHIYATFLIMSSYSILMNSQVEVGLSLVAPGTGVISVGILSGGCRIS
jgi:hypothetical protein